MATTMTFPARYSSLVTYAFNSLTTEKDLKEVDEFFKVSGGVASLLTSGARRASADPLSCGFYDTCCRVGQGQLEGEFFRHDRLATSSFTADDPVFFFLS